MKKREFLRDGLLVTAGGFAGMVLCFLAYFLFFRLFMALADRNESFSFVAPFRVLFGIVLILVCLLLYRSKMKDWLKASVLAASLATFMIGMGVQLYLTPRWIGFVLVLVPAVSVLLLFLTKRKWFHYYAVALSLLAVWIYL